MPPRKKAVVSQRRKSPAGPGRRVKVSVEPSESKASTSPSRTYTCQTCGRITRTRRHLCTPVETKAAYVCSFCGAASGNARHVCSPMLANMKFYCEICGRVTPFRGAVCRPKEIR